MNIKIILSVISLFSILNSYGQKTTYIISSGQSKSKNDSSTKIKSGSAYITLIGTLDESEISERINTPGSSYNLSTHPIFQLICNGKRYNLNFTDKTEFIKMGVDGKGSFKGCYFYDGTYKVIGVLLKKSINVKSIECLKHIEGHIFRTFLWDGILMFDPR